MKSQTSNKSKVLALLLLFLTSSGSCIAQFTLSGVITSASGRLPGVNTSLLHPDSTFVTGVAADTGGIFSFTGIQPGTYLVRTSMVGYETFVTGPIAVTGSDVVVPEIIMREFATTLNDVQVIAEKVAYEQQTDKLVLNLASSVTSTGNTVLDVLQKSPGVLVNRQNGSIAINGRSGVRIMIDGKILQVPADAAIQMLDGMNAGGIEAIELIAAPTSQYDADGSAGVIHIRTKTSDQAGTNIQAGITVGTHWAENIGATLNASHRSKLVNFALDYSFLRNHNLHTMALHRETKVGDFNQVQDAYSRRENVTTQQNLSLGAEWLPSEKTTVNVLLTAYKRDWKLNAVTEEQYTVSPDATFRSSMLTDESNVWRSVTGSVGLLYRLSTTQSVALGVDALFYENDNPSQYQNTVTSLESQMTLAKGTPIRVLVGHVDYTLIPTVAWRWDIGVKGHTTTLTNHVSAQRYEDGSWHDEPDFSSSSDLDEEIAAAYVNGHWNAGATWKLNAGLRYEYTQIRIATPLDANLVNRAYGNFFPNVSIRKNISVDREFLVSYVRRITRPTYNDIAPFVFFWATNTFSAGNTALYPAIADQITISYRLKQWNISIQGTQTDHAIAFAQPERIGESPTLIFRSQNTDYSNNLALVSSTAISIARWWEVTCALTLQYQRVRSSHLEHNFAQNQPGIHGNVVSQIKLPKGFSFEVSGMYQSMSLSGAVYNRAFGALNAGVQKTFRNNGSLRFAIDDMLNTNNWLVDANPPDDEFSAQFHYRWYNRYFRLTYSFGIGNQKLKAVRVKGGAEEERGRVAE